MHKAAANGRKDRVEVLIHNNADIEAEDQGDDIFCFEAANYGQLEIVKCSTSTGENSKQQAEQWKCSYISAQKNTTTKLYAT